MKFKTVLGAMALATAAVLPAQAAVVTFEGVAPGTLLFPDDGVIEDGYEVKAAFSASVIDSNAAFGPGVGLDLAGPKGNATQFFIGLNDGSAVLTATNGAAFRVTGFDFGFVSALANLFNPGDVPGFMLADYVDMNGAMGFEAWQFDGADANGEFSFQTVGAGGVGALGMGVTRVEFYACTFDAMGCAVPNANFNQFALDNIGVAAMTVSEPASLALVSLALGLTVGLRRRAA